MSASRGTDHEKGDQGSSSPSVVSPSTFASENEILRGEKAPMSLTREVFFVAIACSAQLLSLAGLAQAIAPIHMIGNSFGNPSPGQLSVSKLLYQVPPVLRDERQDAKRRKKKRTYIDSDQRILTSHRFLILMLND